jgi:hypothetical protein
VVLGEEASSFYRTTLGQEEKQRSDLLFLIPEHTPTNQKADKQNSNQPASIAAVATQRGGAVDTYSKHCFLISWWLEVRSYCWQSYFKNFQLQQSLSHTAVK